MNKKIENIFNKYGFNRGRLISYSKSRYRNNHPNDYILFNGNIFTKKYHKMWWGDLNITKDSLKLQEICNEIDLDLIIVSEMIGSFGGEKKKFSEIKKFADCIFKPNKDYYKIRKTEGITTINIDNMNLIVGKPIGWEKIKHENKI